MTEFKLGDRVFITSHDHPWARHAGEITGPFSAASAPDLKWTVSLDGQQGKAAVAESDIRKLPEGSRP